MKLNALKWAVIFIFIFPVTSINAQVEQPKVLVLNSYHKGFPWTDNIVAGIESVLKPEKNNIEFIVEYMDTKAMGYGSEYKQSSRPVYTTHLLELPYGVVGGKVLGGFYHGEFVAGMAKRILAGETISSIPFVKNSPTQYVFNYVELERWGIKLSDLPEG